MQDRVAGANKLSALRSFTLESGQAEIERLNRRRKERNMDSADPLDSRRGSVDGEERWVDEIRG